MEVAPGSVYVVLRVTRYGLSPTNVITGPAVITVLVIVVVVPFESVALYIMVYVPNEFIFKSFVSMVTVSPPLEVAPGSV